LAKAFDKDALEQACKDIIETILFCLPNAFKGTVYRIGIPPAMNAKRVTTGIIDDSRETISWGLPAVSDYNPPGKPWIDYRDEPNRPLEAMSWCVEHQKSWTSEDPETDERNIRSHEDQALDYHHMEPVLTRKEDLDLGIGRNIEYARNYDGELLWKDSEYEVVAVIKIHFRPGTIKIASPETRIIKRLSRSLGTEILHYQLTQRSLEAIRKLADDRLHSCNILADSLRNAITKSGLIFSLIKLELGALRDQWEQAVLNQPDHIGMKSEAIRSLNEALADMNGAENRTGEGLISAQSRFLKLSLPPEQGENWVRMQIEQRWEELLQEGALDENKTLEIQQGIDQLKKSLYLGKDPEILASYDAMPDSLKKEWVDLIYSNTDRIDFHFLDQVIQILQDKSLHLPFKEKSKKSLIRLKALAEIMGQLEENTNVVLRQVLNGNDEGDVSRVLDRQPISPLPRRMKANLR
jgi:hypothetical protein